MSDFRLVPRRTALLMVLVSPWALTLPGLAHAAKPEDVFKGHIILTKDRLPTRFSSEGAFVAAVRKARMDKVWPAEEKGNDHALWNLEYIAFSPSR